MIVVADSGPLHYLILLDQTELLSRFYGQVIVPEALRDTNFYMHEDLIRSIFGRWLG